MALKWFISLLTEQRKNLGCFFAETFLLFISS